MSRRFPAARAATASEALSVLLAAQQVLAEAEEPSDLLFWRVANELVPADDLWWPAFNRHLGARAWSDAAASLVGKVLPGWRLVLDFGEAGGADLYDNVPDGDWAFTRSYEEGDAAPGLAALRALAAALVDDAADAQKREIVACEAKKRDEIAAGEAEPEQEKP